MVYRRGQRRYGRRRGYNSRYGSRNNGVFGGQIMSVEEVQALSDSIKQKEKQEFEEFEKMFDADLRNL